jgi:hypothetical protein
MPMVTQPAFSARPASAAIHLSQAGLEIKIGAASTMSTAGDTAHWRYKCLGKLRDIAG